MPEHGRIPPLELEALKVLWDLEEATVREIQTEMTRHRPPLAYTTVMTLLDRLTRRGAVERRKQGRAHIYSPLLARETARELAIDRLTHDYFQASRQLLRDHLSALSRDPKGAVAPDNLDTSLL
jgi:BlaI family penicillinase repressor